MSGGGSGGGPGDRNKTVFRPSPLQGMRQGQPPAPPPGAAPPQQQPGWGAPPPAHPPAAYPPQGAPQQPAQPAWGAPPPQQAPQQPGWGAPPPAAAQPPAGSAWAAQSAPAAQPNAVWGQAASEAAFGNVAEGRHVQAAPLAPSRLADDDVPLPQTAREVRNIMLTEAAPVLALAAAVRAGRVRTPMAQFHREATAAIATFDRAITQHYPEEKRQRAKYAVCATLDDIAQNLPNVGGDGAEWARRSMVVQFFHENIGGDRFWQLVDDLLRSPVENRDLIELFHACLAAGFEGRFRVMPDGKRRLHEVMQRLNGALEHVRSISLMEVSPHWRGEDVPAAKPGFWRYIMLAAAGAAAFLLLAYIIFALILMFSGQAASDRIAAINPADPLGLSRQAAPPPATGDSPQASRLKQFLAPEIAQGLVKVEEDSQTVRVRTTVGQLFQSGSDVLEPGREALFQRIGKAIEADKQGVVTVEGHADSDKVSSLAFPDNMALSQARAETVAKILRATLTDASRIVPKGFGETRPIASNDNDEGKSLNRRVEVIVPRDY